MIMQRYRRAMLAGHAKERSADYTAKHAAQISAKTTIDPDCEELSKRVSSIEVKRKSEMENRPILPSFNQLEATQLIRSPHSKAITTKERELALEKIQKNMEQMKK